MEAFNCLSLHHLITHRLSRIKTCDYQDKEGCSLNGSNEFLMESGFVQFYGIHSIIFDSRGVVVSFQGDGDIFHQSEELDKTMLNFKQFIGIVRSTIPIVEEERETLKVVLPLIDRYLGLSDEGFQTLVHNPTKFFKDNQPTVSTCFGHVISFGPFTQPVIFNSHNFQEIFSSFDQLAHLKSLDCVINKYENVNTQILDEFGSVFESKLVHLSISFKYTFSSNQIEDCFSRFTRLKHLVLHHVPKFHPSLINDFIVYLCSNISFK